MSSACLLLRPKWKSGELSSEGLGLGCGRLRPAVGPTPFGAQRVGRWSWSVTGEVALEKVASTDWDQTDVARWKLRRNCRELPTAIYTCPQSCPHSALESGTQG